MKWDFSCIDPVGSAADVKRALHDHINAQTKAFINYYKKYLCPDNIEIDSENAVNSLTALLSVTREAGYPVYLLIDEYDNFANEILMDMYEGRKIYEALVYEKGPLKTLFKVVKSLSNSTGFAKTFITGVSPVVMSDVTSGYNIAKNIYLDPCLNHLCGFTRKEIEDTIEKITDKCELGEDEKKTAIRLMHTYYNGYMFAPDAEESVYNPTLAIYFMEHFHKRCKYPRKMLDANLAVDEAKLRYVARLHSGKQMLLDLIKDDHSVIISDVADRFGIQRMLSDQSKDKAFFASFFYYFGILTMDGLTEVLKLRLKVPNLVVKGLYLERIQEMLLPEPTDRDDGNVAAEALYIKGEMQPLCDFIEHRYFKVFHNRDYRWANELTVKTAFLTLLYNDILYMMDSEKEISRRYADLTMILRPDMQHVNVFDILIEFKFVSLKDAGLTGERVANMGHEELKKIGKIKSEMEDAKRQVKAYGDELEERYGNLKLKRYVVVSLGYERLWWEEII